MGFLNDRKAEAKEAIDEGDSKQGAEILYHALLEGPGTFSENLKAITDDPNS
ncbi:hypothetical protein [Streptomyces sp. NPDC088847]|uniref:hypothetical protein n=1 Tax=Streptomyces sp. NPDC088847 TaxID=3365909 RepID=UPI00381B21A0